jgi:uncharacterized protein YjiS (DUF1127 family)
MSISFLEPQTLPVSPPAASSSELHQRNSWHAFASAWRVIDSWAGRRSQRLTLRDLSEQQLDDIGLTRTQARREAAKPFWRK